MSRVLIFMYQHLILTEKDEYILIFVYNKLYRYKKHKKYKFDEVDIIKFAINFVWQMSDY